MSSLTGISIHPEDDYLNLLTNAHLPDPNDPWECPAQTKTIGPSVNESHDTFTHTAPVPVSFYSPDSRALNVASCPTVGARDATERESYPGFTSSGNLCAAQMLGGDGSGHIGLREPGTQPLDVVHWLPVDSNQSHQAIRHYAADATTGPIELNAVAASSATSSSSCPVVSASPSYLNSPWTQQEKQKPLSNVNVTTALVLSIISAVFCGLVPGLGAFGLTIQARMKSTMGHYSTARQLLSLAYAFVVVSFFIGVPVYIYIVVYHFAGTKD